MAIFLFFSQQEFATSSIVSARDIISCLKLCGGNHEEETFSIRDFPLTLRTNKENCKIEFPKDYHYFLIELSSFVSVTKRCNKNICIMK